MSHPTAVNQACRLTLSSFRPETREGLDAVFAIRYYSRALLIHRLLTFLPRNKRPKHILSILAATTEAPVNESDFSLSNPVNYGKLLPVAAHSATFTSLVFERLAKEFSDTAFVHSYPGLVKTSSLTSWVESPLVKWLLEWIIVPLLTPFTVGVEEAGERHLFYLTSQMYPSFNGRKGDTTRVDGVKMLDGLQRAEGDGAYLVSRYGETGEGKCMKAYREREFGKTVWEHTLQIFEEVEKKSV